VLPTVAGDVVICTATVVALLVLLAVERQLTVQPGHLLAAGLSVAACSCPVARRTHPLLAAVAGGALGGALALIARDTNADAFSLLFVPVFLLAYSLGTDRPVVRSVGALLVLGAGVQAATWPWNPAEAFDVISAVARQADAEIEQLVDLLDTDKPGTDDGLRLIAELATRAAAAGLDVRCRFDVAAERLSAHAAQTAYRVVQESLTNALKHAPGAPVQITVSRTADRQLRLSIASGQSAAHRSGLETSGAGRGLAGMRERVTECGGDFSAGPVANGWLVAAAIPMDC
jgi:signal transduction histidine kinase